MENGEGLGNHLGGVVICEAWTRFFVASPYALQASASSYSIECLGENGTDTTVGAKPPMSHSVQEWKEFANPEIRKNVYSPYGYKKIAPGPKIILVNKSLGSQWLASRIYGLI